MHFQITCTWHIYLLPLTLHSHLCTMWDPRLASQCGSDLAQVSTKAIPQPDGTYKITGTKIFISCGEHDMTNNIVHCVLARLPDAPPGIKGISLFLVPKHKVSDSGDISEEFNGANIGRIEDKMGCHGSSTCEINFEDAEGYLIGTEHKGMNHMFTFINTSRLGTSMQGVAAAENSFQNALAYCKERRSMRALNGTIDEKSFADPLIVHGDIRKNLLFQRAVALGGRSMIYQCVQMADEVAGSGLFVCLSVCH
jgi:alkylation response protein AidB-like acyl-CoA dehydrogenase